jgi:hypothetical protein
MKLSTFAFSRIAGPGDIRRAPRSCAVPAVAAGISRLRADQATRKIYFRVEPDLRRREFKVESRAGSGPAKISRSAGDMNELPGLGGGRSGLRPAEGRDSSFWRVRLSIVEGCGEERTPALQDLPAGSRYERVYQDWAVVGVRCRRAGGRDSCAWRGRCLAWPMPGAADRRSCTVVVRKRTPRLFATLRIPRPTGHLAAPQVTRILPSFPEIAGAAR